jgi:hypothetical protein
MPYREKLAWLSIAAMALTFGPYFVIASSSHLASKPMPNLTLLGFYGLVAGIQLILQGAGRWWFAYREREYGVQPPDERDRAIEYRSIRVAYFVLIGGMILVGCVMPFNSQGWQIINAAIAMIAVAELVHYGIVIVSYRRQV